MTLDAQIQALATRIGNLLGPSPAKSAGTISNRLDIMTDLSSCSWGAYQSGQYYDNGLHGAANGSLIGVANRMQLVPFLSRADIYIDQLGCVVSTAVAGSLFKIQLYSTLPGTLWPDALLYETSDISGATAGWAFATPSGAAFAGGRGYWLGVRHNSTCTLQTIPLTGCLSFGLSSSSATSRFTVLQRTITYSTAAPSSWSFVPGDRVANVTPPAVRFRAI